MKNIILTDEYKIYTGSTSTGTQDKYYKDGCWYKVDNTWDEGYNESIVSQILSYSSLDPSEYVVYEQININNSPGCVSKSFIDEQEEYISLYRLYKNSTGQDITDVYKDMSIEQRVYYTLEWIKEMTELDYREHLANLFVVNELVLNYDCNVNNFGVIFNGKSFRPSPIFDNGRSFFSGLYSYRDTRSMPENISTVPFKPFGTITDVRNMLRDFETIQLDKEKLKEFVNMMPNNIQKKVLSFQLAHMEYQEQDKLLSLDLAIDEAVQTSQRIQVKAPLDQSMIK